MEVWVAVRAALRGVLSNVSLADIATGKLPNHIPNHPGDPAAGVAPWFDCAVAGGAPRRVCLGAIAW
jgi:hypothetical protein